MKSEVITGNNIDTLKNYPDNYFDSVITDPPYGIEFLNKDWDSNTGAIETWEQVFRVLKPGGYLLAFSAARTYHHLATNIESVGFEIRDQIMWIYASGFPKAQDVGKNIQKRLGVKQTQPLRSTGPANGMARMTHNQSEPAKYAETKEALDIVCSSPEAQQWSGWKTALKPAHEPIVMARKPFKGSTVDNVLEHGVGALNIDATRIDVADSELEKFQSEWDRESAGHGCLAKLDGTEVDHVAQGKSVKEYVPSGRFPSNVMGEISDEYQKYFYCPKVSRAERHIGFTSAPSSEKMLAEMGGYFQDSEGNHVEYKHRQNVGMVYLPHLGSTIPARHLYDAYTKWSKNKSTGNNHPTVKPVALMKYLVTLVTPAGGKVLDPFTGSGSTGMAVVELGMEFTGCELDPDYVDIATKRIQAWHNKTDLSGSELPTAWFDEVN